MKKKIIYSIIAFIFILTGILILNIPKENLKCEQINATVIAVNGKEFTVQDKNNVIYTFNGDIDALVGSNIVIEYTGLLDKNREVQTGKISNYTILTTVSNTLPDSYNDNGIFKDYYNLAYNKLSSMTIDEKIGQLLLVRYSNDAKNDLSKYKFSGFVFFEKDFKDKTKQEVINMINELQKNSNIPLLTAVDEEGGKIVRVSSNTNLRSEKFKSSQELYDLGGFDLIKQDTIEKSNLLSSLGLNLNLAPVVDVSTDPNSYMYDRTLGKDATITSTYAKTVIEVSKGTNVSYTLKHFPGYGNNADTHTSTTVDTRTYDEIMNNDILPFKAGIEAGAEAVLVSHNIVNSIDSTNPASLSSSVHNLLRNNLNFTGIIITDDLDMGAVSSIDNSTVKALLAGNDLIITTDYEKSINEIKTALNNGTISEELINKEAFRVLAWKYYKGLMLNNYK